MTSPGRYRARTVAEMTGVGRRLLLAWEKRHALLEPERAAGGGRLYTEEDVRVLRRVQELLGTGLSIGEVAARGREALLDAAFAAPARPARAAGAAGTPPAGAPLDRIVRGALDLDGDAIALALDDAFAAVSPEAALETVVAPAALAIGDLWARGRIGVAGEHLASALFRERAQRALDAARRRGAGPLVVAACAPDELHELGLILVALRAARAGARVAYLGPALPLAELDRACDRLAPATVALSVSAPVLAATHATSLAELAADRRGTRFVVGGQAWTGAAAKAAARLERAGVRVWRGAATDEALAAPARAASRGRPRRR